MGGQILLFDDEPNIIEAIRFILTRGGYSVASHGNGLDAMAVIVAASPDLVILDLMLPGRSGFAILQDLRSNPDTAALPVLMLTAKGQPRDREMAERLGASLFLSKPFANTEILASVRSLLAPP